MKKLYIILILLIAQNGYAVTICEDYNVPFEVGMVLGQVAGCNEMVVTTVGSSGVIFSTTIGSCGTIPYTLEPGGGNIQFVTKVESWDHRNRVTIINIAYASENIGDDDGDGVCNNKDDCGNTPFQTPVDIKGCSCEQGSTFLDCDSDGDGVEDKYDECNNTNTTQYDDIDTYGCSPDQRDPLKFTWLERVVDDQGRLIYAKTTNERGDIREFGMSNPINYCENQGIECTYIENNPGSNPALWDVNEKYGEDEIQDIISYEGDGTTPLPEITQDPVETEYNSDGTYKNEPENPNMEDGENNNTTNSLETDYLSDIVKNTSSIANNQKDQKNTQDESNRLLNDIKRELQNQSMNNTSSSSTDINVEVDTPTAEEIAQAIKNNTDADRASDDSDAQTGLSALNNLDMSTYTSQLKGAIDTEDYEEPGSISDESWYQSFVNSNPLISAINNSGVNLVDPACSITANLGGNIGDIELSMCGMVGSLNTIGTIFLSLVTLGSLIMVLRG
ncbi:MAG: hypothetical protein GY870_16960 [archaeon]|nr:hypothetical protein [archaeon]